MADDRSDSSMEEILSSIKRIIAEDKSMPLKKRTAESVGEAEGAPLPAPVAEEETVLELTDSLAVDDTPDQQPPAPETEERAEDRLIDDSKLAAMRQSLTALAAMERVDANKAGSTAPAGAKTVEDIATDLLRPMLKEWLDAHLPALVEEMVAKEIQRISQK